MPTAEPAADESGEYTYVLGTLSGAEERSLARLAPSSRRWRRTDSLAAVCESVARGCVDRVLLFQSRPGEIQPDAPEELRCIDMEIELLSVAGAWCEGEHRTGQPWSDVPRVYWYDFAASEATAGVDAEASPMVLVRTRDYDSASAWIDVLADAGCAAVWAPSGRCEPLAKGEQLAVWDGGHLDGYEATRLAEFCRRRRASGAAVIAVLDFPRADAVEVALDCGAAAVLGRPWSIEQVESLVAQFAQPTKLSHDENAWQVEQVLRAA